MTDPLLRTPPHQDWLTLVLLICFAIACVVEYTSSRGMLRSWFRYSIKIDHLDDIESRHKNVSPTSIARLLIFVISISILVTAYKEKPELASGNFVFFLQNLVMLTCFYLLKYYLSKLLAYIAKLELIYIAFQNLKSYHYGILGYAILILLIITTYSFSLDNPFILYTGTLFLFVLTIVMILSRSLRLFTQHPYYFLLYLCALEIGPYLLLYKYFIV